MERLTVKVKVVAPLWPSLWETSLIDRSGAASIRQREIDAVRARGRWP